jgi:uncharacterized protein YmfQ (DUF2313 family)
VNAGEYKALLYRVFPRGKVWPVDIDTTPVWDSLLDAMALEPARIDAAARQLLTDFIPTADMGYGLLDLWENWLGLTPQAVDSGAARVFAIRAKLAEFMGASPPELQAFADLSGLSAIVSHHEYPLFRMGLGAMGDPLRSPQFAATWTVTYHGAQDLDFEAAMCSVSPPNTTLLFVRI